MGKWCAGTAEVHWGTGDNRNQLGGNMGEDQWVSGVTGGGCG